ncbi:ras-related protein Rab-14-like [Histomonas meleagridis]|uniref:ras-related protein Rab-14-like n=1 Tax=Histomonas meleagridis TaxID=135588 RepID=UPI0035596B8A|nr:ras-related protein Rab-14-like [Histomonas meleagridis]KAH0796973.1 ras-related protein Rab-14-like [Histomonas meleagridis]
MEQSGHQLSFKFVLVGDSAVGKTAICKQFCEKEFNENQAQTIGLDFGTRVVEIQNTKIQLHIWDTAGQERFRSVTRAYFRSSAAVFLVYDVTNRESFNRINTWFEDATQSSPPTAVKVLVGNKTDLTEQRAVSSSEAKSFAEQHGLQFFETSALSGDRIDDTFIQTAHLVYSKVLDGQIALNNPSSGARAPLSAPPAIVDPTNTNNNNQQNSCC